ncbi:CMP-sialic acid transporter 5 [Hibiscus syriacus]|uniref:CMP-sialic acid transporter 5 n=1 Tax=Hibiscus syriacus TaxID=106335 RepID=A0A6A3A057_HIBSY|nr:CMP-sialic acid transporter 5 [Hibiscus syriacus]
MIIFCFFFFFFSFCREVIVTSSVLTYEIAKVVFAIILMAKDGSSKKLVKEWTLMGSLTASGLPATIYALQNILLRISYKNLDSLTLSIQQRQSIQQFGALLLLIAEAVLLSIGEGSSKATSSGDLERILFYGIVPVSVKKHSSYLMTVEMSIVGSLCLLSSTFKSPPDGEAIKRHGFFYGWTPLTLIPVATNALGGILVGLITSLAGGVTKGFVIVSALPVTAMLQFLFEGKPPSTFSLMALPLVINSVSIYQKYPYRVKNKEA